MVLKRNKKVIHDANISVPGAKNKKKYYAKVSFLLCKDLLEFF